MRLKAGCHWLILNGLIWACLGQTSDWVQDVLHDLILEPKPKGSHYLVENHGREDHTSIFKISSCITSSAEVNQSHQRKEEIRSLRTEGWGCWLVPLIPGPTKVKVVMYFSSL